MGSCGRPFDGMELRIVDPVGGQPLPAGQVGRIQIRGRNILRGICGREREDVFTPDGWYDGGDTGRLDSEGFLYFAGRGDDMLKIKGVTVSPAEVEAVLQSIPGVQRAYATGVTIDGVAALGAAVIAAVPGTLALDQVRRAAGERLSAFKLPARWLLVESMHELPHTITGKIDKPALQALLTRATPA
jgi:acyl-CoA synthetase (AMP-forming)/AMP-acid ligase II